MQVSFRDPDGFVYRHQDRILRCVYPHAAESVRGFLSSPAAGECMARGMVARASVLTNGSLPALPSELRSRMPEGCAVLEHDPVPFVSYPYEWAPEMLHAAAAFTLQLARAVIGDGYGLKDATPYNLAFDGPRPVFLDVLSFERRDPLDPLWRPYAQFVRTFIYPLLAARYFGLRLDETLLAHRDGLEPERVARLCPAWRLLLPPFLGCVTIPLLLARGGTGQGAYRSRRAKDGGEAKFMLEAALSRAERLLERLAIPEAKGAGSRYFDSGHRYTAAELDSKERIVAGTLDLCRPRDLLDIGCNTGRFSVLAARKGARVVAIDRDAEAAGVLWRTADEANLKILPLVIDVARPPGACGWENLECPSFLDRGRTKFDCVLMLALIHHLIVNERVPLDRIFELAARFTREHAIVEYVDPADEQFQRIARGRDALHRDVTTDAFELAARRHFEIVRWWQVTPARRIYWLRKGDV